MKETKEKKRKFAIVSQLMCERRFLSEQGTNTVSMGLTQHTLTSPFHTQKLLSLC